MMSFSIVTEALCPKAQFSGLHEKFDRFWICDGCFAAHSENSALLRPRLSPLKASGSKRLAKTAPRQVPCCVHAGDERSILIGAEPHETTRLEGSNPSSCFVAVTGQASGSDAALHSDGHELWRSPRQQLLRNLILWKARQRAERTQATHFYSEEDSVHGHEAGLGNHDQGHDPVSICPTIFELCALAPCSCCLT